MKIAHLSANIAIFRAQSATTHGPADPGLYHPLNSANFNPIDKKRGFVNISLNNHQKPISFLICCIDWRKLSRL